MRTRVLYVERKPVSSPSIERVFRQVAKDLPSDEFEYDFQSVPYADGPFGLVRNLLSFRPRDADIYHITGHVHYIALRLPKDRTVLTIHDLIILHIRHGIRRWMIEKLYFKWPLNRLRYVTAISDFTKREIKQFTGRDDVRVIENPLIDGFDPAPKREFDGAAPVILHIGTAPNKNLPTLISALEGLPCILRIIGPLDDGLREALRNSGVEWSNAVGRDQIEMSSEYRQCDIVSFCTTYEGFGLPIIEAQAMEKPLITSDLEPHRSVAGVGAVFVDPTDPQEIRNAVDRVIGDPDLRRDLIEAGRANINRFDPKKVAGEYAELYRRMIAGDRK